MKMSGTAITIISLLITVGATILTSEATTSFNRSTLIGIDQGQRTVTFKTIEGQTWTLPLADPNIVKNEQLAKGDQVSIEIDLSDRVIKIIKLSGEPRSERPHPPDDLRP